MSEFLAAYPDYTSTARVAFNFTDDQGAVLDERVVARDTSAAGISVRTGCFCNPGAGESAFGLTRRVLRGTWRRGSPWCDLPTMDDYLDLIGMPSGGAVRVSLGLVSNLADVERFLDFAERTYPGRRTRPRRPGAAAPLLIGLLIGAANRAADRGC